MNITSYNTTLHHTTSRWKRAFKTGEETGLNSALRIKELLLWKKISYMSVCARTFLTCQRCRVLSAEAVNQGKSPVRVRQTWTWTQPYPYKLCDLGPQFPHLCNREILLLIKLLWAYMTNSCGSVEALSISPSFILFHFNKYTFSTCCRKAAQTTWGFADE